MIFSSLRAEEKRKREREREKAPAAADTERAFWSSFIALRLVALRCCLVRCGESWLRACIAVRKERRGLCQARGVLREAGSG